jgi:hypothetical protein
MARSETSLKGQCRWNDPGPASGGEAYSFGGPSGLATQPSVSAV